MGMSNKAIRKMIHRLGGKADMSRVERTAASVNTTPAEKRARMEMARDRGILNKPIDPASVSDPKRWYEGKPLQTQRPQELNEAMQERKRRGGDRFPR